MSPRRGVSPHGGQGGGHPPGALDSTPSMSDRLFRLGLAESQVGIGFKFWADLNQRGIETCSHRESLVSSLKFWMWTSCNKFRFFVVNDWTLWFQSMFPLSGRGNADFPGKILPRAFYCPKMWEKSKSTTFSYYKLKGYFLECFRESFEEFDFEISRLSGIAFTAWWWSCRQQAYKYNIQTNIIIF